MSKVEQIEMALVASGSGTDARAIIQAHKAGLIPEISKIRALISTAVGAGNIEVANGNDVQSIVIDYDSLSRSESGMMMTQTIETLKVPLVFLVGCKWLIRDIKGVTMYNIHPHDKYSHGGKTMHGLKPHRHFLDRVIDEIIRGRRTANQQFFCQPTVHNAQDATGPGTSYDCGSDLLTLNLPVPQQIIWDAYEARKDSDELDKVAKRLQDYILKYEWMLLPGAVRLAAQLIIDGLNAD